MIVVTERIAHWPEEDKYVYHLPKGRWSEEAEWQEIHCGGGIVFPWRENQPKEAVCAECRKSAKK